MLVFFGCAAVLVFNNTRGVVAAPARPATRLAPATVKIDAEDTWNAHLAWLSRSRLRRQRVA